jgi:ankyrin repeat protein
MKGHNHDALVSLVRELETRRSAVIALSEAVRWNLTTEIKRLLTDGVNVNGTTDGGRTPLMYATEGVSARLLLEAGADPNAVDLEGATSLIWFCKGLANKSQASSYITFLLNHGADASIADHGGKTAFDYANGKYDDEVMDLLG